MWRVIYNRDFPIINNNRIMVIDDSKYYEIHNLLTYNALFSFVVSPRGNGKTYNAKRWMISDFLKNKKQFVYVRRLEKELETRKLFFNDILHEFPDVEFKVEGYCAYINGEIAGYFIPLSKQQNFKSTPYPEVNKIIFDEFIPTDTGLNRKLKNEVLLYLDLYETIARDRRVRAVFLGNRVSTMNDYFLFFGLDPDPKKRFNKFRKGLIVVEMFTNSKFIKEKQESEFGQLIEGTAYSKYAIENEALQDKNSQFINCNKPKDSIYKFTLIGTNTELGVYYSSDEGCYYIDDKTDPNYPIKYTNDVQKHSNKVKFLRYNRNDKIIERFREFYILGNVRIKDYSVAFTLEEILKIIL